MLKKKHKGFLAIKLELGFLKDIMIILTILNIHKGAQQFLKAKLFYN